jgi:hypothetical protein
MRSARAATGNQQQSSRLVFVTVSRAAPFCAQGSELNAMLVQCRGVASLFKSGRPIDDEQFEAYARAAGFSNTVRYPNKNCLPLI